MEQTMAKEERKEDQQSESALDLEKEGEVRLKLAKETALERLENGQNAP